MNATFEMHPSSTLGLKMARLGLPSMKISVRAAGSTADDAPPSLSSEELLELPSLYSLLPVLALCLKE